MWQRIQTLFLIITLIITSVECTLAHNLFGKSLAASSILLTLVSTIMYKKQTQQLFLNRINLFIQICILVFLSGLLSLLPGEKGTNTFSEKVIEWYYPLLVIVWLILANIYIRRDYKLVKSIERLR